MKEQIVTKSSQKRFAKTMLYRIIPPTHGGYYIS